MDIMDHPYSLVCRRLYIHDSQCSDADYDAAFVPIAMDQNFSYAAFCEDFGPVNLACVHTFCNLVRDTLDANPSKDVVVWGDNAKSFTNAAFLVGAYLIIERDESPKEVMRKFESVSNKLLSFRDVSPGRPKFELHLQDCWEAIEIAKDSDWISAFDYDEYEHYSSPRNADLNVIIPDKFIAMAGPVAFPGDQDYRDTASGCRQFAPHYALEILQDFDVQAVVRLNEPEYDRTILSRGGIAVIDLFFEDCCTPPPDVVLKFMAIVEHLEGPIAVHCKAGLGRTGTLIALYLMKHHGFTARQAIAWLRIVRPGSVIGQQQDFLCSQDKHMPRAREVFTRTSSASSPSSPPSAAGCLRNRTVPRGAPTAAVDETVAAVFACVHRVLQAGLLTAAPAAHGRPSSVPRGHGAAAAGHGRGVGGRRSVPALFDAAGGCGRGGAGTPDWDDSDELPGRALVQSHSGSALSELAGAVADEDDSDRDYCCALLRRCKSDESPYYPDARLLSEHVAAAAERRCAALARRAAEEAVRRRMAGGAAAPGPVLS